MFPFPQKKIPSGKLTKQWKITIFNGKYIFKGSIFHCYVSLPEFISHDWQLHPSELISRTHEQHQFQTTCFGKKNFCTPSPPKQICNFTAKTTPWFAKHHENKPNLQFLTPLFSPFFIHLGTPKRLEHLGCYSPRRDQFITRPWWFQHVSSIWKKMLPPDSESVSWKMRDEHWRIEKIGGSFLVGIGWWKVYHKFSTCFFSVRKATRVQFSKLIACSFQN